MNNEKMLMEASPHVRKKTSVRRIMIDVCIALLPAAAAGCVYFGMRALVVLLVSSFSAVLTEFFWRLAIGEKPKRILQKFDFTSLVTGLLLGLTLPPLPYNQFYIPLLGSVFAVGVVKMLFGGTGKNIVNPAIAGRVFCFISFTAQMDVYPAPLFSALGDAEVVMTGATHLKSILEGGSSSLSFVDLFLGTGVAGSIGETCALALIAGYAYLVVRRVINFGYPLLFVAVCGLLTCALYQSMSVFIPTVLGGGLLLGAIFMATDYVTSPNNKLACCIYYVLLGAVTALLRKGTQMEVVSFAILLMNLLVPLFDAYIRPRPFGYRKERRANK